MGTQRDPMPGDVYRDRDWRMQSRYIRVLTLRDTDAVVAICVECAADGTPLVDGKTVKVRAARLAAGKGWRRISLPAPQEPK